MELTQARRAIEQARLRDRILRIDVCPGTDVRITRPDSRQAIGHQGLGGDFARGNSCCGIRRVQKISPGRAHVAKVSHGFDKLLSRGLSCL